MVLPSSLIQTIQHYYADVKYKEGTHVVPSIDAKTISSIIEGFLSWSEKSGLIKEDKLDLSFLSDVKNKKV